MTLNSICRWDSSPRSLENVEYLFTAITPRFTQTRSDYTCQGPIYGSNWNVLYSRYTTIHAYMRKLSQHNNEERAQFFGKIYLSHFIGNGCERVMCERWVGDWTNCNLLTPSSFVFSRTSFSFCWAGQSGDLRAHSPLLGAGSLYSILSPTNSNKLNFLSHRVISLFDDHLLLVGVTSAPNSIRPQSRLYLDIFDWMHLFLDTIYQPLRSGRIWHKVNF